MLIWYSINGLSIAEYIIPCMLAGIGGSFMMGAGAGGAMEPLARSPAALPPWSAASNFYARRYSVLLSCIGRLIPPYRYRSL